MQRQNIKIILISVVILLTTTWTFAQQLAFPGAEGYGRFTTGGRGGEVIEVTNLNDSGAGSFRAAVQTYGQRTIVFRISGTIALKSSLNIAYGDLTIAGQTAPGDGICIRDYPVTVDANNVIIRYMRFRLGDEKDVEADGLGGRFHKNIIIDHCSASWSVDECISFYQNENLTLQWCLISESLYKSVHEKGNHGYGGIWGGYNCSFHHNLLAHHTSRNPRFASDDGSWPEGNVDSRNNVIYNWGGNSCYGGENSSMNVVANYYKYGPATSCKNRIAEPSVKTTVPVGEWYIEDNYVFGYPEITEDNWAGGVQGSHAEDARVADPHPYAPVLTHTAGNAYQLVLANAGTVRPKRDTLDTRVVWEAKNQTALYGASYGEGRGIIDTPSDVGGWPELNSLPAPDDSDHDGMPDTWEDDNGLDKTNPDDRNDDRNGNGYTNLEEYLNSLCLREDFILPPAELKGKTSSPTQIDLNWKEITPDETGFVIERSTSDTSNFQEAGTVSANDTSWSDMNLAPGTVYYYRVLSRHETATSFPSNIIQTKTLYADGSPTEAFDPFPADSSEDVTVSALLKWTSGSAANSHDVYLGTSNPPPFLVNVEVDAFDPRGLEDASTYFWRIDEVNDAGTTQGIVWQFTTESFTPAVVGHWDMDRGAGSLVRDNSSNRNHAYLKNGVTENWTEGYAGNAMSFDGIDDYLQIDHDDILDVHIRGFTLAFWLKTDVHNKWMPLISKRLYTEDQAFNGYEIFMDEAGKLNFVLEDDSVESVVTSGENDFVSEDWMLVTTVRDQDNDQLHLYKNGIIVSSTEDKSWNISQQSDFHMGGNMGQQNFFKGILDDLRLWNYALTSEDVATLYNNYLTGVSERRLVSEFKLSLSNYPNPFNPETRIHFTLPQKGKVTLIIFNTKGQVVKNLLNNQTMEAGNHFIHFNGDILNSGVYIYRLQTGSDILTQKMILIK